MKINLGRVLAALALTLGPAVAQVNQSSNSSIALLSVCDVLSNPGRYDGKIIRLRARMANTDGGVWFLGDDCPGVFVTRGKVWPSWIAWGAVPEPYAPKSPTWVHQVDFYYDDHLYLALHEKALALSHGTTGNCLEWTYTGMFETYSDWSKRINPFLSGPSRYMGFGHLGQAPGQLIPKSADDVSLIPNCKFK